MERVSKNSNRQLTPDELEKVAKPLLNEVRARLQELSAGDPALHFALRRKLTKELGYDERSKPMHRKMLKLKMAAKQGGKCAICQNPLPEKNAVLDRFKAMDGYIEGNVRLLCPGCDTSEQEKKGYA